MSKMHAKACTHWQAIDAVFSCAAALREKRLPANFGAAWVEESEGRGTLVGWGGRGAVSSDLLVGLRGAR